MPLDAMDEHETGPGRNMPVAEGIRNVRKALEAVAQMTAARHLAIGRGQDLRLEGDGLVGGALIAEGALIHLGVWSAAYG